MSKIDPALNNNAQIKILLYNSKKKILTPQQNKSTLPIHYTQRIETARVGRALLKTYVLYFHAVRLGQLFGGGIRAKFTVYKIAEFTGALVPLSDCFAIVQSRDRDRGLGEFPRVLVTRANCMSGLS